MIQLLLALVLATQPADPGFRLEKIAYQSDGLRVYTYLYSPVKPGSAMPAVIFNRGSYVREEFADEVLPTFRRLAAAGFVVIAPMYRQSGGGEGRDEMGGADVNDLMKIRDVLAELKYVDPERLFMYGESRGGMMTFQAIRDGFPIRAAATFGAFTDLAVMVEENRKIALQIWPDYDANASAIKQRRSALSWPEKINVPLLNMHGGNDRQVNPAQSLAIATKLQSLGKTYELIIKAGENHVMSAWREERDAAAIEWFRRFDQRASAMHVTRPAAQTP